MSSISSSFSAAEQGLGYIFQSRFALLKALELPEDDFIFIERNDDVEFVSSGGVASLGSLKHKAKGDRLTDLSVDFWKSVRIWLAHYMSSGRAGSTARFMLFSTASVAPGSFLAGFAGSGADDEARAHGAAKALAETNSAVIVKTRADLEHLNDEEKQDFYGRITIIPEVSRIDEIPSLIDKHLRTIRRESRQAVFERLEGWWTNLVIIRLAEGCKDPIKVQDVSDKLAAIADEYKSDSLPITFRNSFPASLDALKDSRVFVEQLRALELSESRIQHAIIDYYRAFEQRSSWARENLLVSVEIEEYEDRLVDRLRARRR